MNHSQDHFFGVPIARSDRHTKMRDVKIVVHRAINRIDDPLNVTVTPKIAFFFTQNRVSRVIFQNDLGDQFLATYIQL